jgi:hypothetical protein
LQFGLVVGLRRTDRPAKTTQRGTPAVPVEDRHQRPTIVPAFDPEDFARESESRPRVVPVEVDGESTLAKAHWLHVEGKHDAALLLLAPLLECAPLHPEAIPLANECREAIERLRAAIDWDRAVLIVAVPVDELKRHALDSVTGFLLSLLDGATDVETLLDISGLPRSLVVGHLRSLLERGIIARRSG